MCYMKNQKKSNLKSCNSSSLSISINNLSLTLSLYLNKIIIFFLIFHIKNILRYLLSFYPLITYEYLSFPSFFPGEMLHNQLNYFLLKFKDYLDNAAAINRRAPLLVIPNHLLRGVKHRSSSIDPLRIIWLWTVHSIQTNR